MWDEQRTASGHAPLFVTAADRTSQGVATAVRSLYAETAETSNNDAEISSKQGGARTHHASNADNVAAAREPSSIRLSDAAIARVVRTLEPFDLSRSPTDILGRAWQRVLTPAARAGMGQYLTPHEVVEFLVQVVQPSPGEYLLDPFAGSGYFLLRSISFRDDRCKASATAPTAVDGIEKSERMIRIARVNATFHRAAGLRLHRHDSLADFDELPNGLRNHYDVILTNPPFGCVLGPEAIAQLGHFELANIGRRKNVPLEVLGIERWFAVPAAGRPFGYCASRWISRQQGDRTSPAMAVAASSVTSRDQFAHRHIRSIRRGGEDECRVGQQESAGTDHTGRKRQTGARLCLKTRLWPSKDHKKPGNSHASESFGTEPRRIGNSKLR